MNMNILNQQNQKRINRPVGRFRSCIGVAVGAFILTNCSQIQAIRQGHVTNVKKVEISIETVPSGARIRKGGESRGKATCKSPCRLQWRRSLKNSTANQMLMRKHNINQDPWVVIIQIEPKEELPGLYRHWIRLDLNAFREEDRLTVDLTKPSVLPWPQALPSDEDDWAEVDQEAIEVD